MIKQYYVDLQDGYQIGDIYQHPPESHLQKPKRYVIIEIEAFNQLMLVEEIEDE